MPEFLNFEEEKRHPNIFMLSACLNGNIGYNSLILYHSNAY
jgi:hypothetical protein